MASLGVLVVGAGARGTALARGWSKVDGARVIAVVDPDRERAAALAAELGAETVGGDYAVEIPRSPADVVVNATPAFLHRPVTELAASHGKHVLSEKPIALTIADADATIAAVERAGVVYGVCHQLRHGAAYAKAKELILGGAIGRPLQIRSNYLMPIRPKILMHSASGNGGPVIDFVCHRFDYWRNLLECEPARIWGRGNIIADDKPELASITDFAVDTVSFVAEFESGDIWGCNICWGVPPGVSRPGYEDVIGRDGAMVIGNNQITITRRDGEQEVIDGLGGDLDHAVAEDMARCIRQGGTPKVDGPAAREALRGSLAVLEACRTGEPVSLDG